MSKRIAFINFLETVTSFIKNEATVAREWILPDRDMTVAGADEVSAEATARANADTNLTASIVTKLDRLQIDDTPVTDNYSLTLAADNNDEWLNFNITTDKNLTVPLASSQDFPIGFTKNFYRTGAGTLTVVATGGVTITSTSTGLTDYGENYPMALRKVGTNTWKLYNGGVPLTETSFTLTTSNVANITSISSQSAGYFREGKRVNFSASMTFAKGATGATSVDITIPFTFSRSIYFPSKVIVNGTQQAGMCLGTAGTSVLTCYATTANGSFAASQTHTISFSITFPIQ